MKKTIDISEEQHEFIKQQSKRMNISQTAVISIAIQTYIDQQLALKEMSKVDDWLNQLKGLKDS